MNKLKYLVFFFAFFFACQEKEKKEKPINYIEHSIKRSLLDGYYAKVNKNIGVSIYHNNIFIFSTNKNGFSDDKFLFHLVKEDRSFDNYDFNKEKYLLNYSVKSTFSPLNIVHKKIKIEDYKDIRIGQFSIKKDKTTENIWSKQISIEDILNRKKKYLNEYKSILDNNILNTDFKNDLVFGKFFEIKSQFYILLSHTNIYLITKKEVINKNCMLRFVKFDNSFYNKSFNFDSQNHQVFLEPPYSDLRIAKIGIPNHEDFYKIRIGQFNELGNIWAQEVIIDEIDNNELLKYNNEFKIK